MTKARVQIGRDGYRRVVGISQVLDPVDRSYLQNRFHKEAGRFCRFGPETPANGSGEPYTSVTIFNDVHYPERKADVDAVYIARWIAFLLPIVGFKATVDENISDLTAQQPYLQFPDVPPERMEEYPEFRPLPTLATTSMGAVTVA